MAFRKLKFEMKKMDMRISEMRESLRKKGWYFCFQEAWKRIWPIWWSRDIDIVDQIYERRAYRYLKRKYQPLLERFVEKEGCGDAPQAQGYDNTIWVCWLQGEENAPLIVKKCIRSIKEHSNGMDVHVVTNENLPALIDIPDYITDKLRKRKMQYATYSDYIRLALLTKYGGIWIDATVLLTSSIPDELVKAPLFCFKSSYLSKSNTVASSWFIIAQQGNIILQQVKILFESYWKKETHLCNYFLFHLLFALVVDYNDANRTFWRNVPYINNVDVHTLQFELFEPYDAQRFEEICSRAFAHKLTYKFKDKTLLGKDGTFYQFILKDCQ